jgi:hypothetical protein
MRQTNLYRPALGIQPPAHTRAHWMSRFCLSITLVAGCLFLAKPEVTAQMVFFLDRFNGLEVNPTWEAALPNAHCGTFPFGTSLVASYAGAPSFVFQTFDGDSVLRLSNHMGPLQRRGWDSSTNFYTRSFRYEVRFNTLQQSPTTSVDAFMEIWILDADRPDRYDIAGPYGGGFGTDLYFFTGSSIDDSYRHVGYVYQNNTWYRLVLEGAPGRHIRASLCNDDGAELIGCTLDHGADVFESGFRIALSQTVGASGVPYPVDVAVDYAILTSAKPPPVIVVGPKDESVERGAGASFGATAAGGGPLKYQWSFRGREMKGQTNSTISLNRVRFADRGNYSVRVSNQFGSTTSSNAYLSVKHWWLFWR